MKQTLALLIIFSLFFIAVPASFAADADDVRVINIKVTADGLQPAHLFRDKKTIVRNGTRVRIVFEYADKNMDTHEFVLSAKGIDLSTGKISFWGTGRGIIEFTVGENGEKFYRLSCVLPCLAMDKLIDYILFVEPTTHASLV